MFVLSVVQNNLINECKLCGFKNKYQNYKIVTDFFQFSITGSFKQHDLLKKVVCNILVFNCFQIIADT